MSRGQGQASEVDERGRPIHRMNGRRSATVPIDAKYAELWQNDKIDLHAWDQFAAQAQVAVIAAGVALENVGKEAAMLADQLYIERMIRQRGEVG
jgi:hypothetical protein